MEESGDLLVDWSQTRLLGVDRANSSMAWKSSSDRSTARLSV